MIYSIIVVAACVWVFLKTALEVFYTHRNYEQGIYVDNEVTHTNQHLSMMYMILVFSFSVAAQVCVGRVEFSKEWIPIFLLVDYIALYAIEHFRVERKGIIGPIKVFDILNVRIITFIKDWFKYQKQAKINH